MCDRSEPDGIGNIAARLDEIGRDLRETPQVAYGIGMALHCLAERLRNLDTPPPAPTVHAPPRPHLGRPTRVP